MASYLLFETSLWDLKLKSRMIFVTGLLWVRNLPMGFETWKRYLRAGAVSCSKPPYGIWNISRIPRLHPIFRSKPPYGIWNAGSLQPPSRSVFGSKPPYGIWNFAHTTPACTNMGFETSLWDLKLSDIAYEIRKLGSKPPYGIWNLG